MKRALIGLVAGFALVGLGAAARANDTTTSSTTMKRETVYDSKTSDAAMAKSGSLSNELTGRVVKADNATVWVEHMGAVIPFKVDKATRFDSAGMSRAQDLKEGQQIRTSFMVSNKTDNLAKTISLAPATGGSGPDSYFTPGKSTPDTKSGIDTTPPIPDDKLLNNSPSNNLPSDSNAPTKTY